MSISSFCIEQHKKEQETLKKFLVYSFAGSAVLHIVLALGISLAWETRPELAEDPIEIILVEEPEVPKAEEQPLKETPKPKPKPKAVETPTPPQPTKTQIPEPIKPQQRAEALPQKPVKQPVPAIPATHQRAVTPSAPTSVEPPTEPIRERRPVVTPPSEPIREPSDPALSPPEPVAINNSAPPRPENNSQPLQTDSDVEKLRERLSEPTTTESTAPPNDDASEANPTSPGAVATNPSAPPRPRGVSGILSDASKITENIRERLGDSFSPSTDSLSDIANPGSPGAVATNPSAPTRPSSSSQPLSGSSSGSQPFRESLGGGSSGERASSSEGDSIANPGVPGEVATNSSAPPRPPGNSESLPVSSAEGCTATRKPEFPSSLANQGIEARPVVELIVDEKGKVIESKLVEPSSYPAINQAALETVTSVSCPARGNRRRVRMGISFAQPGTDFQREAHQRAEKLEEERREREQLEEERREREQLEEERREREQLEEERREREQLEEERREREQLEEEPQQPEPQEQLEPELQEQMEEVPPPEPKE
ncbi:TonB family protein [Coleofasciculus sp.]|uniref:TonB family protein n=1 Tax=Coleofasciculus sp. TaxID=3100458 RepID=UPI0039F90CE8